MPSLAPLTLGAPGVYQLPPAPLQALTGVRMDVCAFVGVAPRGPARVPVVGPYQDKVWTDDVPCVEPERPLLRSVAMPVESWDEYRRLYGSFEGRGLLPYAVASFFEQGGRRAYIVRVVHDLGPSHRRVRPGVAWSRLEGVRSSAVTDVILRARNEGVWGNSLKATLRFEVSPITPLFSACNELILAAGAPLTAGSLLRITDRDGKKTLRTVRLVEDRPRPSGRGRERVAMLDGPVGAHPMLFELVGGTLELDDGDQRYPRRERHEHLGLNSTHPRWIALVLCNESDLVYPDSAWRSADLLPHDADLPTAATKPWTGGADLSAQIVPEDFFDHDWVLGNEDPASGVHALVHIDDVAMVVAADLYSPVPLRPLQSVTDPVTLAGKDFERCVHPALLPEPPADVPDLEGLRLNPEIPSELEEITQLQLRLQELADQVASFVVLLDVPPRLHQRQILAWRTRFESSFAACYHPWLKVTVTKDLLAVPRLPGRLPSSVASPQFLVEVNPAAVAAGVIAEREWSNGIPFGPANELTRWVIDVSAPVSPGQHDQLHQAAVNVYLKERDGVRLTAARTLSKDPAYRQLSVRRLMVMLARALDQQMQWVVFEPNDATLRSQIALLVDNFLRHLFAAGAFEGANESEAFFVRADETLNPTWVSDQGQLIVEVGVAPAEPLEFLVLRIFREGDGTLRVEGSRA